MGRFTAEALAAVELLPQEAVGSQAPAGGVGGVFGGQVLLAHGAEHAGHRRSPIGVLQCVVDVATTRARLGGEDMRDLDPAPDRARAQGGLWKAPAA